MDQGNFLLAFAPYLRQGRFPLPRFQPKVYFGKLQTAITPVIKLLVN